MATESLVRMIAVGVEECMKAMLLETVEAMTEELAAVLIAFAEEYRDAGFTAADRQPEATDDLRSDVA